MTSDIVSESNTRLLLSMIDPVDYYAHLVEMRHPVENQAQIDAECAELLRSTSDYGTMLIVHKLIRHFEK